MPRRNEFTEAIETMLGELRQRRKDSSKANPIPFGMERINRREHAAERIRKLSPQERAEFLAQNSQEQVLRMLRGRG